MLSIWEKQSFIKYNYIVIGSGIVGLSTAISLKERCPNASVLVLERGLLPSGASTKNAGFACFGSISELIEDINTLGPEKTVALVKQRYEGLFKLRKRLGDEVLNYQNYGGFELLKNEELPYLDKIDMVNKLFDSVFEKKPFLEDPGKVKKFGFDPSVVKSIIYSPYEGQIDTGKMMQGLINMANEMGVRILTGAEVGTIEEEGHRVSVLTKDSTYGSITFEADKVAICTNAFTKKLIKDIQLSPGRGAVLVTQPLRSLKFRGVFHMEQGFYYFRNFGYRIILGGGRNLDLKRESCTEFEINEEIISALKEILKTTILPGTDHKVDYSWAGIMAFGNHKKPILKKYSENIYLGVRLGGMGVAIGSQIGDKLSEMMV